MFKEYPNLSPLIDKLFIVRIYGHKIYEHISISSHALHILRFLIHAPIISLGVQRVLNISLVKINILIPITSTNRGWPSAL